MVAMVSVHEQQSPRAEPGKVQVKEASKAKINSKAKANGSSEEKGKARTSTDEETIVTRHRLHINGGELAYTGTTSLMPLKGPRGTVEASISPAAHMMCVDGPSLDKLKRNGAALVGAAKAGRLYIPICGTAWH